MTEQPEWLSKYDTEAPFAGALSFGKYIVALMDEVQSLNDRIARLEAGQRELEARLGDGE